MQQNVLLLNANSHDTQGAVLTHSGKQARPGCSHGMAHIERCCHHPVVSTHYNDKFCVAADCKHATVSGESAG
jgi:hypothetical protein